MIPAGYNLDDEADLYRLIRELSGYLAPDMDCRLEFLNDGTDRPGRMYAVEALDLVRRRRCFPEMRRQRTWSCSACHDADEPWQPPCVFKCDLGRVPWFIASGLCVMSAYTKTDAKWVETEAV